MVILRGIVEAIHLVDCYIHHTCTRLILCRQRYFERSALSLAADSFGQWDGLLHLLTIHLYRDSDISHGFYSTVTHGERNDISLTHL